MGVTLVSKKLTINSFKGSYEVEIINSFEEKNKRSYIFEGLSLNSFLIIDENLLNLFPFIKNYWPNRLTYSAKAGEESKTLRESEKVIKKLIEAGFKKYDFNCFRWRSNPRSNSFIASILFRGVEWIYIPQLFCLKLIVVLAVKHQ